MTFYFCHCGLTLISLDPDTSYDNTTAHFYCKTVIGKYFDLRETTPRPVVPCWLGVVPLFTLHLEINEPSSSGGLQHLNALNVPMTWLYWPYWIAIPNCFDVGWFVLAAGKDPTYVHWFGMNMLEGLQFWGYITHSWTAVPSCPLSSRTLPLKTFNQKPSINQCLSLNRR